MISLSLQDLSFLTKLNVMAEHRDSNIFSFVKRTLKIEGVEALKILASKVSEHNVLFLFCSDFSLRKVDLQNGKSEVVISLDPEAFTSTSNFNLYCSKDNEFVAITWNRVCVGTKVSRGVVLKTSDGEIKLHLDNGYYYTDMAPFPVCFIKYKSKNLVVHATDWNSLDVTDLENGKILTSRDLSKKSNEQKGPKISKTEWPSLLLPSPSEEVIAVQGWMWHPVGVLYSFSLKNWLEHDIWESDYIPEKNIYSSMYDWTNPFCWINETKLCICEMGFAKEESYKTSLFDIETGQSLIEFFGPTPHVFFFDKFLFSGLAKDNEFIEGLSIWSIENGQLLHKEDSFPVINDYNSNAKEFISYQADGLIELIKWNSVTTL